MIHLVEGMVAMVVMERMAKMELMGVQDVEGLWALLDPLDHAVTALYLM
jgi:hypothetical protein